MSILIFSLSLVLATSNCSNRSLSPNELSEKTKSCNLKQIEMEYIKANLKYSKNRCDGCDLGNIGVSVKDFNLQSNTTQKIIHTNKTLLDCFTEIEEPVEVPQKTELKKLVEKEESNKGNLAQINQIIEEEASEADIDKNLIKAIVKVESNYKIKAKSPAGAMGLMQLMPETANILGVTDIYNPRQNIRAGIKFINYLFDEFDDLDLVIAAYNAGPTKVKKYKGIPPIQETIRYVEQVNVYYKEYAEE